MKDLDLEIDATCFSAPGVTPRDNDIGPCAGLISYGGTCAYFFSSFLLDGGYKRILERLLGLQLKVFGVTSLSCVFEDIRFIHRGLMLILHS